MLHHLFADPAEAVPFGDDGDVAVHLAVHLNTLHHPLVVGLEPAVKIVQRNARNPARGPVEKLGRDGFRQRVVTLLLPAAHQVVAIFQYHPA